MTESRVLKPNLVEMVIAGAEDEKNVQQVMAFDFGTKKMGVAIGQSVTGTASPLALVPMKDGVPNWATLIAVVNQWQPDMCLVGLPLNMDDSENDLCARARKFARRLHHQVKVPVWMVDERLSTREARSATASIKMERKGKVASADAVAAVILLESWFFMPKGVKP